MKKQDVKKLLEDGKNIEDIFELTWGQDCMIYKTSWDETPDEIIYIPDVDLNELNCKDVPINEKLDHMYTADDFLVQCCGDKKLAKDLFEFCDWQNPNIYDLIATLHDEEGRELYGDVWDEFTDIPF